MQGRLLIKPISANLSRDTEFIGKMDTYVIFKYGKETLTTQISHETGKLPKWEDIFEVELVSGNEISLEVWDHDVGSADDIVGSGKIKLDNVIQKRIVDENVPLLFENKPAGTLVVKLEVLPSYGTGQGPYPGQYPPQQFPGQYPPGFYPPQGYQGKPY